jgi:predicted MFS family arabinose efflux permease
VGWIEESVPPRRLTEGIAVTMTGMYVGIAPGAAVVGAVVDRHGASASFWVPVVATWLGAAVALGTLLVPTRPGRASAK